jgi:cell division protein FtsB
MFQVCLQREILEQNVLEMKRYIAAKVVELESLIDEMSAMKKHIKAIDENKNFILEVAFIFGF